MTSACFLEPMDVLFLRGNKLFGDAGSHGESLVPPWPSVAAGALRARMLVDEDIDLAAFAKGDVTHPRLGTPQAPGAFCLRAFHLARHLGERVEALRLLPADLVATEEAGGIELRPLKPVAVNGGLAGSYSLAKWPLLASNQRVKPLTGLWLGESGWRRYLAGETPKGDDCLRGEQLWAMEHRVGVGLDPARLRAADEKLFTVQAVSLKPGLGFLALVEGAEPPATGLLRLGGDGRAAAVRAVAYTAPEPDYEGIVRTGRCRIVLTAPAIFPKGWWLPGMMTDGRFELFGITGRVVCAAAPRAEIVSGWDMAQRRPKAAQRMAAAGSVYWIEDLEASVDELRKLAGHGLWPATAYDGQRRAEGFNRFVFAAY